MESAAGSKQRVIRERCSALSGRLALLIQTLVRRGEMRKPEFQIWDEPHARRGVTNRNGD
jgi:hypothetical protein